MLVSWQMQCKLWTFVRYQGVMEAEAFEHMVEKKFGHSGHIYSFRVRNENYPLCKAVVDHDHQRVMSIEGGEISDKVDRELFERQGERRRDGGKWGMSGMVIDFVLLAYGTSSNEGIDK